MRLVRGVRILLAKMARGAGGDFAARNRQSGRLSNARRRSCCRVTSASE